jgi:hypothetical protein
MRLAHINLKRLEVEDVSETIEGVVVWQPYGWFAHIVLDGVTGPEFGELEDLIETTRSVQFLDGTRQVYNYREQMAWIEMYDRKYVDEFVRRGALRDPRVMLKLGLGFFTRLESQLRERRDRYR